MLSCSLLGVQAGRYVHLQELQRLAHPPDLPTSTPRWPSCPTPVRILPLSFYLRLHPDRQFTSFVLQGLATGFHVGYISPATGLRSSTRNHPSSVTNPLVINEYIQEEVAAGRMIGPLPRSISGGVHCSPVGLVPKGRESGRWRMIVDLSYPPGHSVNDGIDRHLCSLKYATLDDATKFITRLGRNTLLLKCIQNSAGSSP